MKISPGKSSRSRRPQSLFVLVSEGDAVTFPVRIRSFRIARTGISRMLPPIRKPDREQVQVC